MTDRHQKGVDRAIRGCSTQSRDKLFTMTKRSLVDGTAWRPLTAHAASFQLLRHDDGDLPWSTIRLSRHPRAQKSSAPSQGVTSTETVCHEPKVNDRVQRATCSFTPSALSHDTAGCSLTELCATSALHCLASASGRVFTSLSGVTSSNVAVFVSLMWAVTARTTGCAKLQQRFLFFFHIVFASWLRREMLLTTSPPRECHSRLPTMANNVGNWGMAVYGCLPSSSRCSASLGPHEF